MEIAAAYLFLLMIAVMNELNAQPIFTHKDCSYIFVFVVLITSSLQANNCTFCISLHLKNCRFQSYIQICSIVNYWLLANNCSLYILNTRGGYLKYRYQGSLCILAKEIFSQVINNIPVYPYTTLRFWWKRLPSLLYYPRFFCAYDQFTWMYMETYLLEMQC